MKIEIPECARCLCVPLRHGILIFGYLNLAFIIFQLFLELWLMAKYDTGYTMVESLQSASMFTYKGVEMQSQLWFIFILYCLEIVFIFILLVGAHMVRIVQKRTLLIRVYYYYGVTTALATFVCYVVIRHEAEHSRNFEFQLLEFCYAFSGLVLQVYLLLLVRSELKKLEKMTRVCFVNNVSESYMDAPYDSEGRNPL